MDSALDAALGNVDWASLGHAYGPATDTPDLIRDLWSEDPDKVADALAELAGSIHHQGSVYPATVAAVPFLVDAALHAPHERAHQVLATGMLADPHHSYDEDLPAVQAAVRAAVREHSGRLTALLHEGDDEIRAAAVYLAAQTGAVPSTELATLWESTHETHETHETQLRIALLFALTASDPAGNAARINPALFDAEPEVRLAAALALQRAGLPWPEGAVDALVEVFEQQADLPFEWHSHAEPTTELILNSPNVIRGELVDRLLRAEVPARETTLWILGELFRVSRSARKRYTPTLAPQLADPRTRNAAAELLRKAGAAAQCHRDELAAIATGYAGVATSQGFTTEWYAVQALLRLGDARWVDALCAGARADGRHHHSRYSPGPAGNAGTVAAVLARLDRLPTETVTAADRAELAELLPILARWGDGAAELAPRLRELVAGYGAEVAMVLAALGDGAAVVVDCLRSAASQGGIAAAMSLWRITAETQPVLALVPHLPPDDLAAGLREAIALGAHLRPLATDLRAVATDESHHLQTRLAAAHALWAATGETAMPTAIVRQSLENRFLVPDALELARLMDAREFEGDVRALLSDDGHAGVAAARTLWAFGTRPDDLMPCLLGCVRSGYPGAAMEAVDLIVEMGHSAAAPVLRELAEGDEALVTGGVEPDIVWEDERLCERLHAAVGSLQQ